MGEGRRWRELLEAFKREAVERVGTSGMTIIAVAEELGLHETVLRRWVQKFSEPGTAAPRRRAAAPALPGSSPADLVAENARLKRENARLLMGRDILRKAALAIVLGPMADDGSLFGSGRPVRFGPLG